MIYRPTLEEIERCEAIVLERVHRARGRDRFEFPDREGRERAGVLGELAAARVLGYADHWPTVDTFHESSDLPGGEEVRAGRQSWHRLPVAPEDRRHALSPFVLVVPAADAWNVVGWIVGREAMQERWWREDVPHACWLVPQSALRAVDELLAARVQTPATDAGQAALF